MKPRLLDVCSKAGGAAMGYSRAGFDVVCLDREPQPRNPFPFLRMDLRDLDPKFVATFDALHFSPPCQSHSPLAARNANADSYDCYIAECRAMGEASGKPWVLENVMSAPLIKERSITLCGGMFGLRTYRHRRFENNCDLVAPPHPKHVILTATKQRKARWAEGWHVSITGDVGTYVGPEAMGIDWMNGDELCEAIPPAYTEFLGRQVIARLEGYSRMEALEAAA